MEVIMRSADPNTFLALRNVREGRNGVEFSLSVSSRGFTGEIPYALEKAELSTLLDALRSMHAHLTGSASLQFHSEETRVGLTMNSQGQVLVSGVFVHYKDPVHRLEFGFVSDQSCLPELIAGLEGLL